MTTYCDRLVTCFESCLNFSALDNTWFFSSLCFLMSFKSGSCRQQQVQCMFDLYVLCVFFMKESNGNATKQSTPVIPSSEAKTIYLYLQPSVRPSDDVCMRSYCWRCTSCKRKGETRVKNVLFGYLRVNQAQCLSDTFWHWAVRHTAGGSTCLQITRGLQYSAIVLLHTVNIYMVNNCLNTCFHFCIASQACVSTLKLQKPHPHYY